MDNLSPGQLAYQAYGQVTDFKNYQGLPMPEWADLTAIIRAAWEAAAQRIIDATIVVHAHQDENWFMGEFDERQKSQINFSRLYAADYHHGADGHNNMMIIAKMADLLDGKV